MLVESHWVLPGPGFTWPMFQVHADEFQLMTEGSSLMMGSWEEGKFMYTLMAKFTAMWKNDTVLRIDVLKYCICFCIL